MGLEGERCSAHIPFEEDLAYFGLYSVLRAIRDP